MKIDNRFTVSAPIDRAWAVLTDLASVAPCLPGAQLTGVDGDAYTGKVKIKIGPVVSEYGGTARFLEKHEEDHRAVINAAGRDSRGAGNAAAVITAQLHPDGEHTEVVMATDLKITGKRIGYIEGAGDKVVAALTAMGYEVTVLSDKDLATGDLSGYQAILTGVRAYNVRESLNGCYERLMKYIEQGGNLIVQYNTSNQLGPVKAKIGPYPFTISRDRVTDEKAEVKFTSEKHPALSYPNTITSRDFENWIQERGIYFATEPDKNYETILSMNDPGEKSSSGSLIIAKYGKGNFVYTGLVFFRELPAGVPGAYRLFVNLLSLPQNKS